MKIHKITIYVIFIISLSLCTSSCMNLTYSEKKYYLDKNNYITVNGIVEYIEYDDKTNALYLSVSNMSYVLDDTYFNIIGENLNIVKENGIQEKLQIGDAITFITAPKYMGDGYIMPIVELVVDEEVLLSFDIGYENFLSHLNIK